MNLKIAIPLNREQKIYHYNPWTAPGFAIYSVSKQDELLVYEFDRFSQNPWVEEDESMICDPMMCSDGCSDIVKADLNHLADHYIILEAIGGCNYIVAGIFCSNIENVLEKGGIEIYHITPFIKEPEQAIKNLLIGLKLTKDMKKIVRKKKVL